DVAFLGIGENGHIAFNDPPADFDTEEPYITVALDHACRLQQVGEGWFKNLDEVPKQAVSMSVRQVLKAKEILAVVPDARKAPAIKACFDGAISPMAPSSILRNHPNATVYLDRQSSALLSPATLSALTASASQMTAHPSSFSSVSWWSIRPTPAYRPMAPSAAAAFPAFGGGSE